ncbi:Sterol desaturase/sphingolipid hydroxylase, fatty acid hydroxylase superfamily [Ruegeria lacuscaerulensis ITI-1157]|nr:Sterol desaturase/sphingolipid hydroxylase, fatty acid hydroxylase superfamily [Ruegeria lacuscaerulensis ITI-1157]
MLYCECMEYGIVIRLGVFLGLFIIFASAEALRPRRPRLYGRSQRWLTNLSITLLNTAVLRLMAIGLPLLAVGAALDAGQKGWGLFNHLYWPAWVEVALSILILDFAIWAQHLVTHKVPILWRLHRVHHADRDMDVTTAVRFHPIEVALSMGLKIGLVYLLGPSALAVILFEILLNGTALFNHSNIRLPTAVDAVLRQIIVTPDMHRVHHSVLRREHDSNYGFALSIWDRLIGTYVAQPEAGHDDMTVGLEWQDDRPTKLGWSLALPFRRK